jgi:hypothetical protein
MDTGKILAELRGERDRISQSITALEALHNSPSTGRKSPADLKVQPQLLQRGEKVSPLPDARGCRK